MNNLEIRDYGLNIKLTPLINIIGSSSSGKTSLLKMLINQINNPNIYIDGENINKFDIKFLRSNIAVVLNDQKFYTDYVKEELLYYQNLLGFDNTLSFNNLDKFTKFFNLEELLDTKIEYLTIYEKQYIKILSLLIINPKILGIDDLLTYLKPEEKLKIIKYAKENGISILNVTTSSEELLLGTDIIILNNHKVMAYNSTKDILKDEKTLKSIGFSLPFIVELSSGLNSYDLLNKLYYDNKSLVGAIWK